MKSKTVALELQPIFRSKTEYPKQIFYDGKLVAHATGRSVLVVQGSICNSLSVPVAANSFAGSQAKVKTIMLGLFERCCKELENNTEGVISTIDEHGRKEIRHGDLASIRTATEE